MRLDVSNGYLSTGDNIRNGKNFALYPALLRREEECTEKPKYFSAEIVIHTF
jgi:hypothetical protein